MRQIALDTETTGLKPSEGHRIIEVGCIELIDRQFTGNNFHQYYNPEREIEPGAYAVHGIEADFLADKPKFNDVIDPLIDYIDGAELIIHNAPFDLGFLEHEFKISGKQFKKAKNYNSVIDTLAMARKMHPGQRNNLDALCKRYKIDNTQRELHGALLDAQLLSQVYLAMTGGQTSFFDDFSLTQTHSNQPNVEQEALARESNRKQPLRVLKANKDELEAHQDYLQKMKKENGGNCVWLNEKT